MNLRAEQLTAHLRGDTLKPLYWVAGDETLLCQEAADVIRESVRRRGFEEREVHFVENQFDWQTVVQSGNSLSLFASRKLIELRMRSFRLDDAARKALTGYLVSPNPDTMLLICSPRPEAAALKTRWFRDIESRAAFLQIWPVDAARLPQWVGARLQQKGITADPDAIQLLCDRVEGNLLAASQEIEKLALMMKSDGDQSRHLDAQRVTRNVADNARFNVFQMVDHALAGDARKAIRVLASLRAEGSEPLMLLGMICRELRTLLRLADQIAAGMSPSQAIQQERIWKTRQQPVRQALQRLDSAGLERLLLQARSVDLAAKGMIPLSPWLSMENLLLSLAGQTPIRASVLTSSRTIRSATG